MSRRTPTAEVPRLMGARPGTAAMPSASGSGSASRRHSAESRWTKFRGRDRVGWSFANTARERLTLIRLFEELRALGYEGGYDAVRRYAKSWVREHASQTADAYVPLTFAPGEAYQFDWSHEIVVMSGVTVTVKVAHVRLCHSRMMFVRTYPRETQEMV